MASPSTSYTTGSCLSPSPDDHELMGVLATPFEEVYRLSPDGEFYVEPALLRGVPVAKIQESSAYWDKDWASLDEFLAKEDRENELKLTYRELKRCEPHNKEYTKLAKLHQDNMSKHVKIREIFGQHTPYHPNQLATKRHQPSAGFCTTEIMYRLACRVSALQVLHDKGELRMDPWDFIRWRMSISVMGQIVHNGQTAKGFIKSFVYRQCDDAAGKARSYTSDPIMRLAILRAAKYRERLNSFNTGEPKRKRVARSPTKPQSPSFKLARERGDAARQRHQKRIAIRSRRGRTLDWAIRRFVMQGSERY